MRNAAVFFCYKELTDVELSAFKYSLLNLRDSFEIFCITKSNLYSYVTKILYKDFCKVYTFDNHLSSLKKYTRYSWENLSIIRMKKSRTIKAIMTKSIFKKKTSKKY